MGQALYRKYRSKSFDDVVGQQHVTKTLQNSIKSGRISHAYLFTGPKGVGKTSVARIFAHAVNNLPYTDDSMHLDIIEIDAASNRRIDEIRDLRERVHIAPTSAKYKVYIIDEVHMLTREAFNALLKTLEEPPEHCIFILATTEAHKLPETIISRAQRHTFRPVDGQEAISHLEFIAKSEKFKVDKDVLELISSHGDGSFRDAIGILDQLGSYNSEITIETASQFLGLPPTSAINDLIKSIEDSNPQIALKIIIDLKSQGISAPKIASYLSETLREKMIEGKTIFNAAKLLRELLLVASSTSPYDQLEISILESINDSTPAVSRPTAIITPTSPVNSFPQVREETRSKVSSALTQKPDKVTASNGFELTLWNQVLEKVRSEAASIYTALRLASPSLNGSELTLSFQFPLHQKKLSQAKNLDIVGKVIEDISGTKVSIRCIVNQKVNTDTAVNHPIKKIKDKPEDIPLKAISNIFGAAEVLES